MGLVLGALALGKKKKASTSTPAAPAPNTSNEDIHLKTAEQILADHRAAQGFGAAPGTSGATDAPTPATGAPAASSGPPGGMVIPPASGGNVIPEDTADIGMGRRVRRPQSGVQID